MISLSHCQNKWMSKRLGDLVAIDKGRVVQTQPFHSEDTVPYIGADGFRGNYSQFTTAPTAVLCEPTDVLMLWDGERSGLCTSSLRGAIGSTVARLRPKSAIRSRFLYHQLSSHFGWIQARRTGTGVPHVPRDIALGLTLSFPESGIEQFSIAAVLDTVDEAIAKTEAVIAKLKQVRAGLLHDLLTRGLDENGLLRDATVHSEQFKASPMGQIPKEWAITRLGLQSLLVTSGSRGWAAYYNQEGPMFLRIGNLTREHINLRLDDVVRVCPPPIAKEHGRESDLETF